MPVKFSYKKKQVDDLLRSISLAIEDPIHPAKHILISGGTPRLEDFEYLNDVYRSVLENFEEVSVDIMMTPLPGLLDFQSLFDLGVNALAINLELHDETLAKALMPLKGSIPRQHLFTSLEQAVKIFGQGRVRSLLMVGLEPIEQTLLGVKALAQRGCEPVLSPFRPDPATELSDYPPPTAKLLAEVFERSTEIAARYGVKLGPRCIPCQHNTVTFPDGTDDYFHY
jgi:biotin synthase-related radical SAM superfamily protein